ncbi:MAG: putative Ig domain-containing protein [Rhodocyclaceae bacterium]|nr:putative Ig domain-containing protein [Rhodocyclaceae bacterium]
MPDASKITSLRADAGISPIAALGNDFSPPIPILIENQFLSDVSNPPVAMNHSQQVLTDALAIYSAYAGLFPSLDVARIGGLLAQSSDRNAGTLEAALDALRITLIDGGIATDAAKQTPVGDRDALYANLRALQDSAGYKALANTAAITLLSGLGSAAGDRAKTDFGALVAVNYLLPFALEGGVSALIGVHADLYQRWQADRTKRADGDTDLDFTDEYLADRAALLAWKLKLASEDARADTVAYGKDGAPDAWFRDNASNLTLNLGGQGAITAKRRFIFDGDTANTLSGGDRNDRLYGGGGDDVLYGYGDGDRLEGNAGADTLEGGEGADILLGGEGDDTLNGGKDADTLKGGEGTDTYVFTSGDGWDTLEDSDGAGSIRYDGAVLAGGKKVADNVWQSADKKTTYSLYDRTENAETFKVLAIQGGNGGLWVNRWQGGGLGIHLEEADTQPPPLPPYAGESSDVKTGWYDQDHTVIDAHDQGAMEIVALGDHGEVLGNGKLVGNGMDNRLHSGAGNDELRGNGGRDTLIADIGDDRLYGGAGDDALASGEGDDTLEGNDGSDVLAGGIGKDVLMGGEGNDYLMGGGSYTATRYDWSVTPNAGRIVFDQFAGHHNLAGDGADFIKGGAGNDYAWGGEGDDFIDGEEGNDELVGYSENDILLGGAGDDKLFGDGSQSSNPEYYIYPQYHGNDILDGGAGNDALTGDGGADTLVGGTGADTLIGDADGIPVEFQGADYLDGGDDNDTLYGYGGADTLIGGAGDDTLEGDASTVAQASHGNDTLDGGDGNDKLQGDGGNDVLLGGAGDDRLFGDADDIDVNYQGADYLDGGDGDDYLRGYAGNDRLLGGAGQDQLLGEAGDDTLDGGADADILDGGAGNDILVGGAGTDYLDGGVGDDTYLVGAGASPTSAAGETEGILDSDGNDTVLFEGISPEGLTLGKTDDGQYLVIRYGDNDTLAIQGGLSGAIETFRFGDTSLTWEELASRGFDIGGSAGNDNLTGTAYEDRITGGTGNDVLAGSLGDDTYFFNAGDGWDTVIDREGANAIVLGPGLAAANMTVSQGLGDDGQRYLDLDFGNGDILSIRDGELGGIREIRFADGTVLAHDELIQYLPRLDAAGTDAAESLSGTTGDDRIDGGGGNDTLRGHDGNDVLTGGAGDDVIDGGTGDDILSGSTGDDLLIGGEGADIYRMSIDRGMDTAVEAAGGAGILELGAGVSMAALRHAREGDDLVVAFRDGTGGMRIADYYAGDQDWQVKRQDGSPLPMAEFLDALDAGPATVDQVWAGFKEIVASTWLSARDGGESALEADGRIHIYSDINTNVYANRVTHDRTEWIYGLDFDAYDAPAGESRFIGEAIGIKTTSTTTGTAEVRPVVYGARIFFSAGTTSPVFIPIGGYGGNGGAGYGGSTYYARDASGAIIGSWAYPPGATLPSGESVSSVTSVWSVTTYTNTWHVPEITGGAEGNSIRIRGWGLADGGDGNDSLAAESAGEFEPLNWSGQPPNTLGVMLYGNDGNDYIYGASQDDTLIGGRGQDFMEGGSGADTYRMLEEDSVDFVMDSGEDFERYREWYYQSQGFEDWRFNEEYGGRWMVDIDGDMQGYDTYDDAVVAANGKWQIDYVDPLPELPAVAGNDYAAIAPLVAAGAVRADRIVFGPGVTADNLTITGGAEYGSVFLRQADGTGVDIALATVGDAVGTGIERVEFADGSSLSMGEVAALADADHDLTGTEGDDIFYLGAGSDVVRGLGGYDEMVGGGGDDTLAGGEGDDALLGGLGNDLLDGGAGSDSYGFDRGHGHDTIIETPASGDTNSLWMGFNSNPVGPESLRFTRADDDLVIAVEGWDGDSVTLANWFAADAPARIQEIWFSVWDDSAGDWTRMDTAAIEAAVSAAVPATWDGNDTLIGEAGDETLAGGLGDDIYVIGAGSGIDRIVDSGGDDTLQFGPGIVPEDISLGLGSLLLRIGGGGDAVHIEGFDPSAPLSTSAIETFRFDDGATLTAEELMARGFDLPGTSGDDTIAGTALVDRIAGGTGNDLFAGGAGRDTYLFEHGDGIDVIEDAAEAGVGNMLRFGAGIARTDLEFAREGDVVAVRYGEGDEVRVSRVDGIDTIEFADGTAVSLAEAMNRAPTVASAIANRSATEDAAFGFTVPADAFADVDSGDALVLSAALSGGSPLPSWLTFDPATGTFGGTPANDDVGAFTMRLTATDHYGASAEQTFSLTVANVNDTPVTAIPLADRTIRPGDSFAYGLPTGAFTDVDAGDVLTYGATLANGAALPSWLSFDAATGAFAGKVPKNAKGSLDIRVTASDGHGAESTASDIFRLSFGKNGGCHGNEGIGNGEDPPPPGHDRNRNDGPGTGPGHPGARDGRNPLEDLARRFAEGRIDVDAVARALDRFDAACDERHRREDRAWREGDGRGHGHGHGHGHGTHAAWTRMNRLLDAHLSGKDEGYDHAGLGNPEGRGNPHFLAARNVLCGSRQILGVQSFQSLQGLQEGVARLG